jgi:hypothetical protein
MTLAPWVYPVGSGLSLQPGSRAGIPVRTLFLFTPIGKLQWGGGLIVLDSSNGFCENKDVCSSWLDDSE